MSPEPQLRGLLLQLMDDLAIVMDANRQMLTVCAAALRMSSTKRGACSEAKREEADTQTSEEGEAMTDDTPTMQCPQCGAEHPDCDGFGFVAHTKPAYDDGCGWCRHPSRERTDDGWRCGICGDVRAETAP